MGCKPHKQGQKPRRRQPSPSPEPEDRRPNPSTPRRSFPLNTILRALSTPLRPPSHHPFLRAFSMPVLRHAEYSLQVRRLCQQGAYQRLPFDNALYINKELACSHCGERGSITQKLVFKQGHAGEWVRVCNNCDLIYYPAQPGTPPDLLLHIEAVRDTAASSSTMVTPDSKPSHSSAFSTNSHSQPWDASPVGGELDDWLLPLLRDLDMEPLAPQHTSTRSNAGSPEPVAGPSSGSGLSNLRNPPLQCARDEEIARMLQATIDEEDAQVLQQFEESPPEQALKVGDHERKTSTLSSLTAELAAIARTRPSQAESSPPRVRLSVKNIGMPSRCSSPESSPSPRPRKKKRVIVHPTPIRGPLPLAPSAKPAAKAEVAARRTKQAKSGTAVPNAKAHSDKPTKPCAKMSKVDPTPDTRPHTYIIISSGDELEHAAGPCTACAPRTSAIRPAVDDDLGSIISITSSESESERAPPATHPRILRLHPATRSRAPSCNITASTCPVRSDSESQSAPPTTQPQLARSCSLDVRAQPAAAIVNVSEGDEQHPGSARSSNKENDIQGTTISCLDSSISLRLAARQAIARRRAPVFVPLAKSSSPSSSSSSSNELDDNPRGDWEPAGQQPAEPQSSSGNMGDHVDTNEVFGDPFRFELYPAVPELARVTNPDVAKRHWVLTIKIWYKNNVPPSTKMIPLEDANCCIRLSDFFIVSRAFRSVGVDSYRIWNRFTTDWDSRSLYEYLAVSITANHTLLIRLPTVGTLSSWAESISQAYGACQTVDPRPLPFRKGKEPAYY